jgi:RHS repeat-associated protein
MAMAVVYCNFNGMMVGEIRGGIATGYVPDTQGSCIATVSGGVVTSTTDYYPYGEVASSTGTNPSPWGYIGLLGYFKDVLNRLYVRARYLRNDLARWLTKDPLWPSEPAYEYVRNLPILDIDPLGLSSTAVANCYSACTGCFACIVLGSLLCGYRCTDCFACLRPSKPTKPVGIPPIYGNYCGPQSGPWGYGWKPGEIHPPAHDELDSCCMDHDKCFEDHGCNVFNQTFRISCRLCTSSLCSCLTVANCHWSPACNIAREDFKQYACKGTFGIGPITPLPVL